MDSRMDKYSSHSSSESRSSRNKKLYDELYNTSTNYTNSVVIDQSKEIDISKIREIVDREKRQNEKKEQRPDINFEEIEKLKVEDDKKVYNINEVLKEAKEKRDIILDASEKRKNSKYESHASIEEELNKTREAYDILIQEETELLDIMNTLTSVKTSANIREAYKDITMESKKKDLVPDEEEPVLAHTIEITEESEEEKQEEKKEEKTTREYSTNTFMFNKKDFIDNELEESLKGTNGFIKALIVILVIGILIAAYYIIKTYILK